MIILKNIKDDIIQAAADARINLEPGETTLLEEKITNFFTQAEFLQALQLDGVNPTFFPHTRQNTIREDTASTSLPLELALKNAPEADDTYFLVPKIVE